MREKGSTATGGQVVAAATTPYTFQTCDAGLVSATPPACTFTLDKDRKLKMFC